jgi:hypothetical protein
VNVVIKTPQAKGAKFFTGVGTYIGDEAGNELKHVRDLTVRFPLDGLVTADIELFPSNIDIVAKAKRHYIDADGEALTVADLDNWIAKLTEVRKELVEAEGDTHR